MNILRCYPLDTEEAGQVTPLVSVISNEELQPSIIISESFTGGDHS